jgi:acyl-CoA thioesterase
MPLPFVEHIGAQILEVAAGRSLLALPIQALHSNSQGVVHGGALFTLADTGMGAALFSLLEGGESCATIEIKINYFKPVLAGTVECRSEVVHRGHSVANVEATLTVNSAQVAKANGTFAIFPARSKSAV